MTEAEEDAQMLKSAKSKRSVVRLDKQPSILAAHCKMYPYQLEGLNWLIKLHDHGINGILADGTFVPSFFSLFNAVYESEDLNKSLVELFCRNGPRKDSPNGKRTFTLVPLRENAIFLSLSCLISASRFPFLHTCVKVVVFTDRIW